MVRLATVPQLFGIMAQLPPLPASPKPWHHLSAETPDTEVTTSVSSLF